MADNEPSPQAIKEKAVYWRMSLICGLIVLSASFVSAAEWNQWRGPNRDGVADPSPALISSLPQGGLKPVWISEEILSGSNGGGWGSPIVSDALVNGEQRQRVYLFAHKRVQVRKPEPKKFLWLAPDKRVGMTDEQYRQYEIKRRDEDEQRAKGVSVLGKRLLHRHRDGQDIVEERATVVLQPVPTIRFPHSC